MVNIADSLNKAVEQYENPSFISSDPIQFPHRFSEREDIEIAGFLVATISWGNRTAIIKSANKMLEMLNNTPYRFICEASDEQINQLSSFTYRTFQKNDLPCFVRGLRNIYINHGGLEPVIGHTGNLFDGLVNLRNLMLPYLDTHAQKHLANVAKGSAGKRLCMFARWMVRPATNGVDFGLWTSLKPADLIIPLDVHVANTARRLGLTSRKQNDWQTATEITQKMAGLCQADPVRYDFALFSLDLD